MNCTLDIALLWPVCEPEFINAVSVLPCYNLPPAAPRPSCISTQHLMGRQTLLQALSSFTKTTVAKSLSMMLHTLDRQVYGKCTNVSYVAIHDIALVVWKQPPLWHFLWESVNVHNLVASTANMASKNLDELRHSISMQHNPIRVCHSYRTCQHQHCMLTEHTAYLRDNMFSIVWQTLMCTCKLCILFL
jgi:hypothetical protein